ncbi:MAG: hypothetical protein FJZ63_02035 [Chlamydiae bacterium]|nr:hypothetical protein [Chlamydiota bacterium]
MVTVASLVKDNPLYQQGVWFNPKCYQEQIPDKDFARIVSPRDRKVGLALSIGLEVVQKVMLIALVVIPSVIVMGATGGFPALVAGVVVSVVSTEPKVGEMHLFEEIRRRGDLFAVMSSAGCSKLLVKALVIDGIVKGSFALLIRVLPRAAARQLAGVGLFFVVFSIARDVEKIVFSKIGNYVIGRNRAGMPVAT